MSKKKTWKEKLNNSKDLPKIVILTEKQAKRLKANEGDTLLVPAPLEVDAVMKSVPRGKLITINIIREKLATKHNASVCCPITAGIFSKIAAEVAMEGLQNGITDVTPFWRTLKKGGLLNEKYPGGIENQKKLLEEEGHTVLQKGKKFFVDNFEEHLVSL